MLDSETKRRIDSARDILVGKVPDPKSQVEQITIALVYKFMDDMDKQSIEMGGKASFFKGEFKKYSWTNIFDPRLGGVEMLNLYGEAITRMSQNDNLPELFRNIFKNAFLPYRDPETLKLFLKTINEFTYDHSEKLGDAFEYLLSVLGSQGDAGQFRTPRHIIDFMVQVVAPKKNETVLDPACGTAGFLISAYKYILESNSPSPSLPKSARGGNKIGEASSADLGRVPPPEAGREGLNAQDKKRIYENFTGYDISPDMVRLSLVNLYLHGFVTPNIHEYDTLTSEDRWNDYFDVILANPPFMSPKGGIKPHKRFSVGSNRSEVLFVDYMAEHLTPNGRAAIIVPEGIIFQSAGAYKQLRKYLIEHNYLWAVVSLPAGAFNPYSGVKTSILLLDKALAKKTQEILFVKVEADGFDLGAQRRPIDRNDLPDALNTLLEYQKTLRDSSTVKKSDGKESLRVLTVSKSRLAENDEYNLSADRYRETTKVHHQWEMVKLQGVCLVNPKKSEVNNLDSDTLVSFIPMEDIDEHNIKVTPKRERKIGEVYKGYTYFKDNDVLVAKVTPCFENGKGGIVRNLINGIGFGSSELYVLRATDKVIPEYIYWMLQREDFVQKGTDRMTGTGGLQRVPSDFVANYQIPLPPLEIQRQIVDEIAAHQRLIDGARQVVEEWKPDINIELEKSLPDGTGEWERIELGEVSSFVRGPFGGSLKKEIFVKEGYLIYEQYHAINNDFEFGRYFIDKDKFKEMKRFEVFAGDVLVSCSGTMGKVAIVPPNNRKGIINQALLKLTPDNEKIETLFLKYLLEGDEIQDKYFRNQPGVAIQNVASVSTLKTMQIPLPPLEVQREIVARIECERAIIEGNRELIRLYEEKVKKVIERVWEG